MICALLLTGCKSLSPHKNTDTAKASYTTAVKLKSYPGKSENCEIEIFLIKEPNKKFEEIAVLTGFRVTGVLNSQKSLDYIKKDACLVGGDAIIFSRSNIIHSDISHYGVGGDINYAVVIKYLKQTKK